MSSKPYELVLNFRSKVPKSKQPQRSRSGCFNCRKYKKKCSEERPTCRACHQKCIQCVWPKGKEPMPKNYQIPKPDKELLKLRNLERDVVPMRVLQPKGVPQITPATAHPQQTTPDAVLSPSPTSPAGISSSVLDPQLFDEDVFPTPRQSASSEYSSIPLPLDIHSAGRIVPVDDIHTPLENPDDTLDWQRIRSSSVDGSAEDPDNRSPFSEFSTDIINYEDKIPLWLPIPTSRTETFITACAVALIPALAPQHTHPLLHASSTWTPFVKINPVMEKVAEACGCNFLAWERPELKPLAQKKFNVAFSTLCDYMSTGDVNKKDHLWLAAAFQLLAVGAKSIWSYRDQRRIDNLKESYRLIKARMAALDNDPTNDFFVSPAMGISSIPSSSASSTSSQSPQSPPLGEFDESIISADYSNEDRKMEVENSLLHNEYRDDLASRFERGWVEAFIYQYGVLLLIEDVDAQGLPNPFEVFTLVRKRTKRALMNCDIHWMNHPVFGASFDAFELACKASYLIRHLDHDMTYFAATKLYEVVINYQPHTIPSNLMPSTERYQWLKDSVLMSEVMLRAVKIVLRKIINLRLDEYDQGVQRDLETAMHKLKQITRNGQVMGIAAWPMLILGLAALDEQDRMAIVDGCLQYAHVVQAKYVYTVIDVLESAWGWRGDAETTARGLNILLETKVLDTLIL